MDEYNLLIVSDLHLCEGMDRKTGKFCRLEDFLFDNVFARLLRYHEGIRHQPRFGGRPWLLILNGDTFDFLQVTSLPEDDRVLRLAAGVERIEKLPIDEQDYGLGTTAEESKWKMRRIAEGHQTFFAALGRFIADGNRIVVIKGNHDLELHWPAVQERLVKEIERAYVRERLSSGKGPAITSAELRAGICFCPWFYYEPGRLYVEHGGQYEPASHCPDYLNPVRPDDPTQIRLPWGSMFVRYLFNKIEDVHPFADNVRPITRYITWAFSKSPIKTLDLLLTRGWVFLRAFWNVANTTVEIALHRPQSSRSHTQDLVPLPPEVLERIAAVVQRRLKAARQDWIGAVVRSLPTVVLVALIALMALMAIAAQWLLASVCLVLIVAVSFVRHWLRRRFSTGINDFLLPTARELEQALKPDHAVRYIVMGHDHQANFEQLERAWYVNTGAWVPVYEKEGPIEWREVLTFFRLIWGYEGPPELLRWDDGAGEPARLVLRPGPNR